MAAISAVVISRLLTAPTSAADRPVGFALYTVGRDGSDDTLLLAEGLPGRPLQGSSSWSPDGMKMAFGATEPHRDFVHTRVAIYHMAGPDQGKVEDLCFGDAPCWSPDGTQLAIFTHAGTPGYPQGGVHTIDTRGTLLRSYGAGLFPEWSPDGRFLLAETVFQEGDTLYLYDVDTGKQTILKMPDGKWHSRLTWGPDGTVIIAVLTPTESRMVQYRIEGGQLLPVRTVLAWPLQEQGMIGNPVFSPAQNEIIFTIQDAKGWKGIYRVSLEERAIPVLILPNTPRFEARDLTISPDGARIGYKSDAFYNFSE